MKVLEGGRDGLTTFCLRPGMESVTSVDEVPEASTQMRHPQIAAQCCERGTGECRRFVGTNNDAGCIAGFSRESRPTFIELFTYGEAADKCESLGLTLCEQSCRNAGCFYNRHPVFTKIPCDAPPSPPPASSPPLLNSPPPSPVNASLSPPPPVPSPPPVPPPSPHPPPPAYPPISSAPWEASSASPLTKLVEESEDAFFQRCKVACARESACVGFEDDWCPPAGRCCRLHEAPTAGFYLPAAATFIKTSASTDAAAKAVGAAAQTTVRINEWDDSYGGSVSQGAVQVSVVHSQKDAALRDWRVIASGAGLLFLGLGLGATVNSLWHHWSDTSKKVRALSDAMQVAGPIPKQGSCYHNGGVVGGEV